MIKEIELRLMDLHADMRLRDEKIEELENKLQSQANLLREIEEGLENIKFVASRDDMCDEANATNAWIAAEQLLTKIREVNNGK